MDAKNVLERVKAIAETFAADRPARQLRRTLDPADFAALREAGFFLTGVPAETSGGQRRPPWGLAYDHLFSAAQRPLGPKPSRLQP